MTTAVPARARSRHHLLVHVHHGRTVEFGAALVGRTLLNEFLEILDLLTLLGDRLPRHLCDVGGGVLVQNDAGHVYRALMVHDHLLEPVLADVAADRSHHLLVHVSSVRG